MLTVIPRLTVILGDLPTLAGIPQALLCPSASMCTWNYGHLLSSVRVDAKDLLECSSSHLSEKDSVQGLLSGFSQDAPD